MRIIILQRVLCCDVLLNSQAHKSDYSIVIVSARSIPWGLYQDITNSKLDSILANQNKIK